MIGFKDTITLARTKLRTKRIRLIVTVIVSGLVFGLVIGALMIFSGVAGSLERYAEKQFDGKYFVSASNINMYDDSAYLDPSNKAGVARAKQLHQEYIKKRRETAAELGVAYDSAMETQPTEKYEGDDFESIDLSSVAGRRVQEEHYAKLLKNRIVRDEAFIRHQAKSYRPESVFELKQLPIGGSSLMKDGKESFDASDAQPESSSMGGWMGQGDMAIDELQYRLADSSLLSSYMLPSNERRSADVVDSAIPVVVPIDVAAKAFEKSKKLSPRPTDAEELTGWVESMRGALNGEMYSVCYRNGDSKQLLQQAILQQKEISANKDKSGYQAPEISYNLPSQDSCGAVGIDDTRNATEKAAEQKMFEFEAAFGNAPPAPRQQKLTFVVVGLAPSPGGFDGALGLESFVGSFVGMNIPEATMIPRDMYEKLPIATQHKEVLSQEPRTNQEKYDASFDQQFLVSFGDIDSARAYIEEQGCSMEDMFEESGGCPDARPMTLAAFGANYTAIDEAVRYGRPVLLINLAIVGTVAGIIIMAMMGRVMVDSRRETAVFRAIGARSSDIVKVYVLYAVAVAGRIALFAATLGMAMALLLELLYSVRASYYAQSAFGVFDESLGFHFIGFNVYILAIAAGIIGLGLVGVSLPLLRNIRRNPIQDMRDE